MICLNINIVMGTIMRQLDIQYMMTHKYIHVGYKGWMEIITFQKELSLNTTHNPNVKLTEMVLIQMTHILLNNQKIWYKENSDAIYPTKTMARPTFGNCRCMLQPSGHSYLLWNVGNGKMFDYMLPYKYMHLWRSSGISMHALFQWVYYLFFF